MRFSVNFSHLNSNPEATITPGVVIHVDKSQQRRKRFIDNVVDSCLKNNGVCSSFKLTNENATQVAEKITEIFEKRMDLLSQQFSAVILLEVDDFYDDQCQFDLLKSSLHIIRGAGIILICSSSSTFHQPEVLLRFASSHVFGSGGDIYTPQRKWSVKAVLSKAKKVFMKNKVIYHTCMMKDVFVVSVM